MNKQRWITALVFTILIHSGMLFSQNDLEMLNHDWRISLGIAYTGLDGKYQLIRGTRKTVHGDLSGNISFHLNLSFPTKKKTAFSLAFIQSKADWSNLEDFTNGQQLKSKDSFQSLYILGKARRYFSKDWQRVNPYFGIQLGYAVHWGDIHFKSERQLPEDWSIVNEGSIDFDVHNGVVGGVFVGSDISIGPQNGWLLSPFAAWNYHKLQASILNDPEDDGKDVGQKMNPWMIGTKLSKVLK